ncbi:ELM2 domain containing protein [Nitzschia inconspicua]|uniref:ELM2 domain containing protein n=1 Tax=Nitzschia inconspicua TaxID=303405 RepID=A0A9K3LL45_9STRA|nr:ELM2 domain containing protein [Nitzschia inconspicua]KAG7364117.1 ELM2 domain containing protein [Nitzschia inconspicua]
MTSVTTGDGTLRPLISPRTKRVKTVFSGFWDEGVLAEDGRTDYTGLNLTIGEDAYEIRVGDAVMLRGDDPVSDAAVPDEKSSKKTQENKSDYTEDDENEQKQHYYGRDTNPAAMAEAKIGDGVMLARVERIWQEKSRGGRAGRILFEARWFLKKEDVDSLPLGDIKGPVSAEEFKSTVTEHDLVLTNQSDENHVTTISGLIQVLYRNPKADAILPSHILPTTYICRYSLALGDSPNMPEVEVLPYAGENDEWHEMTLAAVQKKPTSLSDEEENKIHGLGRNSYNDAASSSSALVIGSDSDSELSFQSPRKRKRVEEGIDEGTTEQRNIRVGREHQVFVPPFIPNLSSVSRHPSMVWKPGMISQEGIDEYVQEAAKILTPFLRERRWTQEEPYAPFPSARLEAISKSLSKQRLPTLSSVSTVSSLATKENEALREVDADALLRNLHTSQYDVKAALGVVSTSPREFVTVWTPQERIVFDNGFRRYSGSLRAIYKGMGNKDLQDVIDYHYRFKIPDQFRRFQERKREQAVRMLECIETRRSLNAPILIPNNLRPQTFDDNQNGSGNWFKTSNSTATVSIEERRMKAKELLLDVESQLGKNKALQIFQVLKDASDISLVEAKTKLLDILRGQKDFQSRFLEFLPHQLRL